MNNAANEDEGPTRERERKGVGLALGVPVHVQVERPTVQQAGEFGGQVALG